MRSDARSRRCRPDWTALAGKTWDAREVSDVTATRTRAGRDLNVGVQTADGLVSLKVLLLLLLLLHHLFLRRCNHLFRISSPTLDKFFKYSGNKFYSITRARDGEFALSHVSMKFEVLFQLSPRANIHTQVALETCHHQDQLFVLSR